MGDRRDPKRPPSLLDGLPSAERPREMHEAAQEFARDPRYAHLFVERPEAPRCRACSRPARSGAAP